MKLGDSQVNDSNLIITTLAEKLKSSSSRVRKGVDQPLATDGSPEEKQWRQWVDDRFVRILTMNIYRSLNESWETFEYIAEHGNFGLASRYITRMLCLAQQRCILLDEGCLRNNKEPLSSLKQEKFQFDTDLPDALGIIEKLKGIRPEHVVETEVVLPGNWKPPTLKGLETIAIVKCHELFEWDVPELTDEIVKSLNQPSLQSVADFRDSLLHAEIGRRVERLKDKIQHTLMHELVKIVDMKVSQTALMETAKVRYQKMLLVYQARGKTASSHSNRSNPSWISSLLNSRTLQTASLSVFYFLTKKQEMEFVQKTVLLLLYLVSLSSAVIVNIDYSFFLPDQLGVATVESAKCCPYGIMPDNFTDGYIPPMIFGIGVQKGGTTTLYSYFQKHPQILGGAKEMHYFDRMNLTTNSYKNYLTRWKENREIRKARLKNNTKQSEVPTLENNGQLFEITPSYFLIPFAACRLKYFTPNAKFIVLLREPASRAHSGFNHIRNYNRRLPQEERPDWISKPFHQIALEGIRIIKSDPSCNFVSGLGNITYNDCVQCLMMLGPRAAECHHQMFVEATDNNLGFRCNPVSKEVIVRGFYGAQLAWWFTLLPPSQFKIFNSDIFFKDPQSVLDEIMDFLGYDREHTQEMVEGKFQKNGGRYNDTFALQSEEAKSTLRQFFVRPNLELYRLLHETGHEGFLPFESYLRKLEYVDCKDDRNIKTGLCGINTAKNTEGGDSNQNKSNPLETRNKENTKQSYKIGTVKDWRLLTPPPISEYTIHVFVSLILLFSSLYSLRLIRSIRNQIPNSRKRDG
eukprot:g4176.t1